MTRDEFIAKARAVHGEGLDYSKVEYKNSKTKVCIIDPEYGEFWQTPSNHLKGQSHPMRRKEKIARSKRMGQEEVVRRFEEKHKGEGLDYSKVIYTNMHAKVCIIDPVYGEFWQEPIVHLKGCGHPRRAIERNADAKRYDTSEFVKLAESVHGEGRYDYSKVEYTSSKDKVCVICHTVGGNGEEHGEFLVSPDMLLQGKGCPKCGNHLSLGEEDISAFLSGLGLDVVRHDKDILDGKEIDVIVPSKSLGIEFDGLRWHSEAFGKGRDYHISKTEKAREKGIFLLHVFEDEWRDRKDVVKAKLRHICGCDTSLPKVMARKCSVTGVTSAEARAFLEANHIQGFTASSKYIGCFRDGELVGVMSVLDEGNGKWNLTRMATSIEYRCQGVCSKMFSWFKNNYEAKEVKTFLDARWRYGDTNVYSALGFKEESFVPPSYSYTDGIVRRHKFLFRKGILAKRHGFDLSLTEREMADMLGWYKIWDCGLFKYIWRLEDI